MARHGQLRRDRAGAVRHARLRAHLFSAPVGSSCNARPGIPCRGALRCCAFAQFAREARRSHIAIFQSCCHIFSVPCAMCSMVGSGPLVSSVRCVECVECVVQLRMVNPLVDDDVRLILA
eukprot:5528905-Prymnesium_polylepis.1